MAIDATEFFTKLDQGAQKTAKAYEETIDQYLRDGRFIQYGNKLSLDLSVSSNVQNILKESYRKANWDIEFHSDQRDGESISMKKFDKPISPDMLAARTYKS